ncbi:MAG: prolyl oligopeptidase family serine peptidase [Betaproteobacteria bacterium]
MFGWVLAASVPGANAVDLALARNHTLVPPDTPISATVESRFGRTIYDPYRWLEDTGSADVFAWFTAQNDYTRNILDALPGRAALHARLVEINRSVAHVRDLQSAGDTLVYLKRTPDDTTFKLQAREGLHGAERLLLDPARYNQDGQLATIEYFSISPNGKRLAVGVALGGTEDATLRVLDVASLREIGAPIPRARGANPVWRFDGEVLFYTQLRERKKGEPVADSARNRRAFMRSFATTGTQQDIAIFGSGLDPALALSADDTPSVHVSPVSPFVIGVVSQGVQNEISIYVAPLTQLRGSATPWRKVAGPEQGITDFDLRGEWIYLLTHEQAPRYQIVRWSLRDPRPYSLANAEVVLPPSERVVRGLNVAKDALYVQETDGDLGVLRRLEYNVKLKRAAPSRASTRARAKAARTPAALPKTSGVARGTELKLPPRGAIQELVTDPVRAGALAKITSWTMAPSYYSVDGRTGVLTRTDLLLRGGGEWSDVVATEVAVKSHDGVDVPLTIVYPKSAARDGSAPLLLEAYGAYGISVAPQFWPSLAVWLEHGGVYAIAHVRGGGELGYDWHRGGYHDTKPNSWRDLVATAQWLIGQRWTAPERLAILGSSAGGLTVSNAMLERPDLFAAMVSQSGFHDALRSEQGAVGPANIPEFGSVATESGLADLLSMSSYARVAEGVAYPAAMLTIGYRDARVDPWDPGKMAARLQAASASLAGRGNPVLLRVDFDGGHGSDTLQKNDETTDLFAFLLWRTGATDFTLP